MPISVISMPNPSADPVTTIVNVAMPIGRLSRRWNVSFHVRSSNGARRARTSGFELWPVAGGGGSVIVASMPASCVSPNGRPILAPCEFGRGLSPARLRRRRHSAALPTLDADPLLPGGLALADEADEEEDSRPESARQSLRIPEREHQGGQGLRQAHGQRKG
jgi:hypothetical protein